MDEYFNIAPYYEKLLSRFLYPLRRNICTYIHHHNHKKIIDVCCGTGKQLSMLYSEGMQLTGVDFSSAMLEEAFSNYHQKIEFFQLNATEIQLPSESYDAVLLAFALHEKNELDRKIIFNNCWNLVRPGGHLIIGDYCQARSSLNGFLFANLMIPMVERAAGLDHYHCYRNWMKQAALQGFLQIYKKRTDIISTHFAGSIMLCSLEKKSISNQLFSQCDYSQQF